LYTSPLFRKSLLAALDSCDITYIVSAKHGVLPLDKMIEPYDLTLKTMARSDRETWRDAVSAQLADLGKPGDIVRSYCGEEYITPLRTRISSLGFRLEEPLSGLSLGRRLQKLQALNDEVILAATKRKFYRIMRRLWVAQRGGRQIAECSGKLSWPERGVYFITPELPAGHGGMPRIIRVGTHAVSLGSRTSLWNRISTHRGAGHGGGSHRSSIFRSHIGRALMNREAGRQWPGTWAKGQSAPKFIRDAELELEQVVSHTIGDMRILWINVPDASGPGSDRAYLERNAIGLLSRAGLLSPAQIYSWLGDLSDDWRIAVSGLWNLDHLFKKPHPDFLSVLDAYVAFTLGKMSLPTNSLAPATWRSSFQKRFSSQLDLFGECATDNV
jgi:hypothetical protein